MVPVGRLVLLRSVEKENLLNAMAWFTAPALLGPVLGPPLGGFIVTYYSWRWIFFINLPIGLLGIYLATRFIGDIREEERTPLDLRGFALMALALGGLVVGFEMAGRNLVSAQIIAASILAGTLSFILYAFHARKTEAPIVDLSLFRVPTFRINVLGGSLFRLGTGAMPFLLPLLFQIGFGYSAFHSGLLTFLTSAGAVTMKLVATPLLRRFGFRRILMHNAWIGSLFFVAYTYFTKDMSPWVIGFVLFWGGFGRSIQFTAINTLAFADIPASHMSRAATLATMMQQLSLSFGVAVGALTLNLTLGGRAGALLQTADFRPSFWIVALISAASFFSFYRLSPNAGAEMSGHRAEES